MFEPRSCVILKIAPMATGVVGLRVHIDDIDRRPDLSQRSSISERLRGPAAIDIYFKTRYRLVDPYVNPFPSTLLWVNILALSSRRHSPICRFIFSSTYKQSRFLLEEREK